MGYLSNHLIGLYRQNSSFFETADVFHSCGFPETKDANRHKLMGLQANKPNKTAFPKSILLIIKDLE